MFKPAAAASPELAKLAVNTLKFLAVDAVEKANSGHPGLPMGAADFAFVLWSRFLKFDPTEPKWADRDRFVLSAGHGSALLYSLLHLSGYDLSLNELKNFRQWGSITPGHPESHLTPGVECTTGPLGQGFANGVGMALAAKMANARYPGLYNHRIWGLVSDGDMMEGISHEAASLAGHLQLGNLTYLYDQNNVTLDAMLPVSMNEDVAKRFDAYGWRTRTIDGHNHEEIASALQEATEETKKPYLILCRTHIGNGAPTKHDTPKAHGEPLGKEELDGAKKAAGWPLDKTFLIPDEVHALWKTRAAELKKVREEWQAHEKKWVASQPDLKANYEATLHKKVPDVAALAAEILKAAPEKMDATRALAGAIMQRAAQLVPSLVGGDADLGGSTKTPLKESSKVTAESFAGKNIAFGIREHAMGAMANGISLYGHFIPFTATFLTFSDYMRPAIRLAALEGAQAIHVFTHDSIFLGEDGPTHQSVEQTSALRLIPFAHVWRPADQLECAAAWAHALTRKDGPSEIILSRQKVAQLPAGKMADALRGGYIVRKEEGGAPDLTIMGTGSELGVCVEAADALIKAGKRVRVVSMPCLEVFDAQDAKYRDEVLPKEGVRVSVEAGRTSLWWKYVGDKGLPIGVDKFGASAPATVLAEKYGLTGPLIAEQITKHLGKR